MCSALKSILHVPLVKSDESGQLSIEQENNDLCLGPKPIVNGNILVPLFLIDTSNDWFVVRLSSNDQFTLYHCITFSPSILNQNQTVIYFGLLYFEFYRSFFRSCCLLFIKFYQPFSIVFKWVVFLSVLIWIALFLIKRHGLLLIWSVPCRTRQMKLQFLAPPHQQKTSTV